jgi:hypothetical protein
MEIDAADMEASLLHDYVKSGCPCLHCGKPAVAINELNVDDSLRDRWKLRDLTETEFFAATEGMGLPEEQQCDLLTIQNLLHQARVVSMVGASLPGTTRSVIYCIRFDNGYALHLAAGAQGATAYRLVKNESYANKLLGEKP